MAMDHSMTLHTALKQRPSWNTKRHNRQMLFIFKTSVCVCVCCVTREMCFLKAWLWPWAMAMDIAFCYLNFIY